MENCLFKVLSLEDFKLYGYDTPTFLMCGYGFNQKAFNEMAYGYKCAAEQLAQHQIELGRNAHNNLLYPIFFCYRQSVELMLKAILLNCKIPFNRGLDDNEREELAKEITSHVLLKLFETIRISLDSSQYLPLIEVILPYIEAMNEFDPSSFYMRYPADKGLHATRFHDKVTCFDIRYTKEHFEHFWNLLSELYNTTEKDWADNKMVY